MASNAANVRAARRRIPNPLKAIDNVWKAAAGPNPPTPRVSTGPTPTTVIAGTPSNGGARRYRKGRGRPD